MASSLGVLNFHYCGNYGLYDFCDTVVVNFQKAVAIKTDSGICKKKKL